MKKISRAFFKLCFSLFGWKIKGSVPDLKKFVIVVAPHTSNYDFFVGHATKNIMGFRSDFLAKSSLFKIPVIGWFLRSVGGHPVDRSKKTNMVDQVVELFMEKDEIVMTVTPEATRKYNPKWKTGFYHIAEKAHVPIVLVGFDYENKVVSFKEPFYVTGDKDADIEMMKAHYRKIKGRNPEQGVR